MGKLNNKKVKINVENINKRISDTGHYTIGYKDFVEKNKDKVFIAVEEKNYGSLYTFEEIGRASCRERV